MCRRNIDNFLEYKLKIKHGLIGEENYTKNLKKNSINGILFSYLFPLDTFDIFGQTANRYPKSSFFFRTKNNFTHGRI